MCGIHGFYKAHKGNLPWADYIVPELFFAGQIRGRDAAGVFAQREVGERPDYCKMAGTADQFLDWKDANERFFKVAESMRFLVGHNRAATIGKNDGDGAHPHVVGNIHLVHNGTLNSWGGHGKEKEQYHSDSHWIASLLNESPDFREVEKKLFGPYALVWHDARDESLNFVRNDGRPLNFIRGEDGGLWFGSEAEMIAWILKRRGRKIKDAWELRPRLWVKIGPDHKIREIEIPFYSARKAGTNTAATPLEEYFQTKEASRAFTTINHGQQYQRPWESCDFRAAPEVQQSRPTERRPSESSSGTSSNVLQLPHSARPSGSIACSPVIIPATSTSENRRPRDGGGGGSDGHQHKLNRFFGLEAGDTIHFYPMDVSKAKQDATRVQLEGVLAVYDHTGMISFVPGVEASTRLSPEYEDTTEPVEDRIGQIFMNEHLFQAEITAIQYDDTRKRIRLWCKEALPLDWFDFKDYQGQDGGTAKFAWERPFFWPTAPQEVAALEKKSYEAGRTSY